ncbi:hypothetical protein BC826DRAFT_362364 [Russula brevipes]|nr:hypothetical protein BC826DRAFT_362364 [Russula brevipes]
MPASPELPGPPSKTTRHTAEDIEHFFTRGSQSASTKTICKPCQKRALSDPSYRVNFQFSASTSTSTLRVHLDHEHKDEYLRLHLARGWTTVLPSMKATDNADTVPNPGSKAQSPAPFSQEAFLEHLVNFIVASDQSIDIVESPEFRRLLFTCDRSFRKTTSPGKQRLESISLMRGGCILMS